MKTKLIIILLVAFSAKAFGGESYFSVLDLGLIPGQVDSLDYVIDLGQSCDSPAIDVNGGTKVATAEQLNAVNSEIASWPKAFDVFKSLGVGEFTDAHRVNQNFWIPRHAVNSKGPVFILLPEAHSAGLVQLIEKQNAILNLKRTLLTMGLVKSLIQNGKHVLNLKEGPKNVPLITTYNSRGDLYQDVLELAGQSTFATFMQALKSNPLITSVDVEDPGLYGMDLLFRIAHYAPGMTWAQTLSNFKVETNDQPNKEGLEIIQAAYKKAASMNPEQLANLRANLCEERSQQMANAAMKMAKESGAPVILLTFGMAHSHGVIKTLEQAHANYALLLANGLPIKN